MTRLSVLVPTYDPRLPNLRRVLSALCAQDLPVADWELIVIDNASPDPGVFRAIDLSWHPRARVMAEPRLGLTWARIAGVRACCGEVVVFVDDDNVLAPDYLSRTLAIFRANPRQGAIGGRSTGEYETPPPPWLSDLQIDLGCRDLGPSPRIAEWVPNEGADRRYPPCAPIGAGMAVRRACLLAYVEAAEQDGVRSSLDRTGAQLGSGGDNDIVMTVLEQGWQVGYHPELLLTHVIPARRLERRYLRRMAHDSMRTWVLVLHRHGICGWSAIPRWSVPARKLLALFRLRVWRSEADRLRWYSAAGQFEARALLRSLPSVGPMP